MSKYVFAIVIFLLLFPAVFMVTGHQGFALRILSVCFWVLLAGFLFYLYETIHEK